MSLPSGLADEDGLPAGIQLLAPVAEDARLYRVGAALEARLVDAWGGPLLDRAPAVHGRRPARRRLPARPARRSPRMSTPPRRDARARLRRRRRAVRPGPRAWRSTSSCRRRPRCSAAAPTPSPPSPTARPARSAWGCPARCRSSTPQAVDSAITIGLALNCSIAPVRAVRAQELLLPGHAEELPDLPVRRADRPRRLAGRRARGRRGRPGRDRARPHGGGHRQVHPRRRGDRAASTAPTTRWSTTTGPASPSSRSSPAP